MNKGDTLQITFYNTEDIDEDHSLSMDAPYAMNHVVHWGENATFCFVASTAGIFAYYCTFHPPVMIGHLSVQ